MRRGPKPVKSKEAKAPAARESANNDGAKVRDLEKRLTEALEQQTATANILRVISRAPAGLGLVLDAVLKIGIRLCEAQFANVFLYNGETFELALAHGAPLAWERRLRHGGPLRFRPPFFRPQGPWRVLHVPDLKTAAPYREREPIWVQAVEEGGVRTFLAVPLVKEDRFLGTLMIYRQDVQLFTDKQIGLLETFADQAVIAIENVRLFTELQEKNEALTQAHAQVSESLEQQTATSEILRVISSSPTDLQPVFDTIIASAVKLCEAYSGILVRVEDGLIHRVAGIGPHRESPESVRRTFPRPLDPTTALGQAILERRVNQLPDTESSTAAPVVRDAARAVGFRAELSVPMIRDGEPIGGIAVTRRNPGLFSPAEVQLLQTFADQAVIAIENVRLFTELQEKNGALTQAHATVTESLERQTATSEILRVISSSPTDVQPVFDAIVGTGVRLCEAAYGFLARYDGVSMAIVAHFGATNEEIETVLRLYPMAPTPGSLGGRTILERAVVHIHDVRNEPTYGPRVIQDAGWRTGLGVPLLQQGAAIGLLGMWRRDVRPFSDRQIELLTTFADQAVIAIENVRLFKELEARNGELTETLEQQTAMAEILQSISSSPSALTPVLDTIVRNAISV